MSLHYLLAGLRRKNLTRPRTTRRATRPRPATCRPRLEPLEVRLSPAVYAITGTADTLGPVITAGHAGTFADPFRAPSLRSAIQATNNHPGGNTIELTVPGIYRISLAPTTPNETDNKAGEFAILPTGGNLTITNTSGGGAAVDGGGLARVFDINPQSATLTSTLTVTLQGFTIEADGLSTPPVPVPTGPSPAAGVFATRAGSA